MREDGTECVATSKCAAICIAGAYVCATIAGATIGPACPSVLWRHTTSSCSIRWHVHSELTRLGRWPGTVIFSTHNGKRRAYGDAPRTILDR